jgi:hypothetical protein
MRILRSRETLNFVYLFVQCPCGSRFGHRADRQTVSCFHCGRVADLGKVRTNDEARNKLLARRRSTRRMLVLPDAHATARRANVRK